MIEPKGFITAEFKVKTKTNQSSKWEDIPVSFAPCIRENESEGFMKSYAAEIFNDNRCVKYIRANWKDSFQGHYFDNPAAQLLGDIYPFVHVINCYNRDRKDHVHHIKAVCKTSEKALEMLEGIANSNSDYEMSQESPRTVIDTASKLPIAFAVTYPLE